jgi:hypothetical protein
MTTYEIEQLIVLVAKYRVEARTAAEAVIRVFDGEGVLVDISLADLCDERGLPAEDFCALVEELQKAGIMTDEKIIPSIMSVEEVMPSIMTDEEFDGVRFTMPADAKVEIRVHEAE